MKLLIILLLLLSSNVAWAQEDCSKIDNGFYPAHYRNDGNDQGIARQNCRIANALENIAEKMK